MSFRARLVAAFAVVVAVPLVVLAIGVRREVNARLSAQYGQRVESFVTVVRGDLDREGQAVADRLAALERSLRDDNRFRLAAVQRVADERSYLLDYAGNAMRVAGLSLLQIHDASGVIVSSGQFRAEYDRLDLLPRRLAESGPQSALVEARAPEGTFLALARVDSATVGGERFLLVGGVRVDRGFLERLARGPDLEVSLVHPGGAVSSSDALETRLATAREAALDVATVLREAGLVIGELALPFIASDAAGSRTARLFVTHPLAPLVALRRSMNVWLVAAAAVTGVVALLLAGWLSSRISRPLRELAGRTGDVNLDRLDVAFESDRRDEVGVLARLLGRMVDRLRDDAARITEAERRATVGELARQVNHDVKNGLMPIRNVFRHLAQVARDEPGRLAAVFEERRATVESGIGYLERLATNYARLSPQLEAQACDVNAVVRDAAASVRGADGVELRVELAPDPAAVATDPLVLRRILENLIANAVESLEGSPGRVAVATERRVGVVRVTVRDTGRGMTREQLDRAFDEFYTTKAAGTGLGLAIVRRLVADLGGDLRVETAPGRGTAFVIELPASERRAAGEPTA